jgi:excisionase family DNA binding protein
MTSNPIPHPSVGFELSPDQLLFTTDEAAHVLSVGRTTIYMLMRAGELMPVHIGRSCRISRGELERYVARIDAGDGRAMTPTDQAHDLSPNLPLDARNPLRSVRGPAQDQLRREDES